jgi:hypothetical protein
MELETGKKEILIKPDRLFATTLIDEIKYSKGIAYLNDSIRENLDALSSEDPHVRFKFSGLYPHEFHDYNEARYVKEEIERLVDNTNKSVGQMNISNIDDILFITYFYYGHVGEVRGSTGTTKYLDDLIDVFLGLINKKLTPSSEDYIWIPDGSTGIETEVARHEFNDEELRMNGGYKTVSRMLGVNNVVWHLPEDLPIVMKGRYEGEEAVQLPIRLSSKISSFIIDHILAEHRKADTKFYKELCSGYINTHSWSNRARARDYKRTNKILYKLIERLDNYLISTNKFVPTQRVRHIFIYDLLILLKLIEPPYKINPTDKYSVIRTICKDNRPSGGNSIS